MIGTMLGNRYELLEKVGEGGMAVVYKAKCHLLNRFVAVKVLKSEFSGDKEFVEKFKREATAAASLTDNNIVNTYDVGTQDGINYIVMEYVNGKTLKEIIRKKGILEVEEALDYGLQIAKALNCAHRNNIIHRDIKPHNIIVTEDGVVKVMDFGIAKASNSVTITNTSKVMGSAHYFSPEQAKGSYVDFRTDIYSLGIVLYEMLTGKVPFDADSPVSVALKHIQENPIPPKQLNPNLPDGLNNLILKAIEKEPIKRYQTINELISDLQNLKNNWNYKIQPNTLDDDNTRVMDTASINNLINAQAKKSTPNNQAQDEEDLDDEEEDEYDDEDSSDGHIGKNKKKILIVSLSLVLALCLGMLVAYLSFGGKPSTNNVTVPQIVGMSQADAKQALEKVGLKLLVAGTQQSDKAAGTVIKCNPDQGSSVQKGTEIRVYISGTSASTVPDLKGITLSEAKDILSKSGIKLGNVTTEYSDTVDKDKVIRQTPDPDSPVTSDTEVTLVVSSGTDQSKTKVPNLTSPALKYSDAVSQLKNAGLTVGKETVIATSDKNQDQLIISQSKDAGISVAKGTAVDISYYKYGTTVPNVIGLSEDQATSKLTSSHLKVNVQTATTLPPGVNVSENQVCKQDPGSSSTIIDIDSTVTIYIYQQQTQSKQAKIGQYAGKKFSEVKDELNQLKSLGLSIIIKDKSGNTISFDSLNNSDEFESQTPSAGTIVTIGKDTLILTLNR